MEATTNFNSTALREFREHLRRYMLYFDVSGGDPEVLHVSFQFLVPECGTGQVGEIAGMVKKQADAPTDGSPLW